MIDAKKACQRAHDEKTAYFLTWLIAPHVKKAPTTAQILEPLYPEIKEERQAKYEEDTKALEEIFKTRLHEA